MEGNVTISKKEYLNLRLSKIELNRLESGGVDNWEWYGDSLNPEGEPDLERMEEILKKEIIAM